MDSDFYKFRTKETNQVSLHDAVVDEIKINEGRMELFFKNGFYLLDVSPDGETLSNSAKLVIDTFGDIENISCKVFKRFKSPFGIRMSGRETDIHSISSKLENNEMKLSIVDELRGYDHIYLRGTVLPYKKHGLSDMIIIEVRARSEAEYLWN